MSHPAPPAAPESAAAAATIAYARSEVIPPIADDASPEEREAYWIRYVYQGDRMPQLTLRAVLMGGFIGMFMSISNLYTTVKLGWAFGVAITACVISFVLWNAFRVLSFGRLSQMSILENNCMQSTASAAGYSTGGTIGTAFGALLLITGAHVDWKLLLPFTFFTAGLGVFLAIPMKRQMINVEQLKFPSGIAAAETLRSLYSHGVEALRKAYALLLAMLAGGIVGLLRAGEGMLAWLDKFHEYARGWLRIPELIAFPSAWAFIPRGNTVLGFGFEPSVLLIGAGLIVGMRVSMSMLAGSVLLYMVAAPLLLQYDMASLIKAKYVDPASGTFLPTRWALWGGTSIMVFSSLTAVALQWKTLARAFSSLRSVGGAQPHPDAVAARAVEVPFSWFAIGMIPISIGMIWVNYVAFGMAIWMGVVAVALSFVLSLVMCRAVGETDTGPMGAMGKVTQLLYALMAPKNLSINLMSAGTTACAAGAAADLLTDLKSGYLLGANARKQFLAQFFGVFFGTLAIVPAWYLMFPDAKVLDSYNPPAANMWKAVAEALVQGLDTIPYTARIAILVGALLGIALPLIGALAPRLGPYVPSAMGLGLAWVMPFQNTFSFAIGAVIGLLWLRLSSRSAEAYTVPIASGLIAGESLMAALLAIMVALPTAIPNLLQSIGLK